MNYLCIIISGVTGYVNSTQYEYKISSIKTKIPQNSKKADTVYSHVFCR